MILEQFPDVQKLSSREKLLFMNELWQEMVEQPEGVPVDPEIIAELDRRMEDFRTHPDRFTTWESVRDRILNGND